jgi:hypothetical protein
MSGTIATVFFNIRTNAWDVRPPKITLDATNPSVDHWNLHSVYKQLAPKKVVDVKIVFTDGPLPPRTWTPDKGPLGVVPGFDGLNEKLTGSIRNPEYGLYTYDVIVRCEGEDGQRLDFPIDPQIDNLAPPDTPFPYGEGSEGES